MLKQILGVLASTLAMACSQNPAAVAANSQAERSCVGAVIHGDSDLDRIAGCRSVRGDLVIHEVSSLEALRGLNDVRGKLTISDTQALHDLHGLETLRSVRSLELSDNAELHDVSALANLTAVRTLRISGNPELADLQGLGGIHELEEFALVHSAVSYVSGLEHLRRADQLVIADNPKLIGIGALNGVEAVQRLVIERNPRLSGYFGLLRGLTSTPLKARVLENRGLTTDESAELARTRQSEVASR